MAEWRDGAQVLLHIYPYVGDVFGHGVVWCSCLHSFLGALESLGRRRRGLQLTLLLTSMWKLSEILRYTPLHLSDKREWSCWCDCDVV